MLGDGEISDLPSKSTDLSLGVKNKMLHVGESMVMEHIQYAPWASVY